MPIAEIALTRNVKIRNSPNIINKLNCSCGIPTQSTTSPREPSNAFGSKTRAMYGPINPRPAKSINEVARKRTINNGILFRSGPRR